MIWVMPGRTDPSHLDSAIRAEVRGKSCQVSGQVTDLRVTGAAVRVDVAQDGTFAEGERVTLVLGFEDGRSVQADATVQSETEMDGYLQFGFSFVTPSAIREKLPPDLLTAFNERAAFRVAPRSPVSVLLQASEGDLSATGHLRDISVDGLGVIVDHHDERLTPGLEVDVGFSLPGVAGTLSCAAQIRNRRALRKKTMRVGLCFDWTRSSDAAARIRQVTDFVMARQREQLQSRVDQ